MTRSLTLALLISASACGGSHKTAPATTATSPSTTGSGHEGSGESAEMTEHEGLSSEMKAFHDLLAPLWHAEKGPQRLRDTCAAIDQFKTAADAVATSTPPLATNADTWTKGTRALVAAVSDLAKSCANNTGFEASFEKVHEAFHALMAQAGGHGAGADMTGSGSGSAEPAHDHQH